MAKQMISPEEFAEKHARRLKGSLEDMRAGIERVTEAPSKKAVAKQDKMLQNLTQAVTSGKWARNLNAVSLESWKQDILEKGLGRVAGGVDRAHDKVVNFASQLLAHEASLLTQLDKMPDLTLEDSINRATAWIRGMSKFSRK
jgi:hypothetical protein